MLEIDGLYTGYADAAVLKNINISIEEGQFVAVLGSNNAGKSTLLNCISGVIRAWQGTKIFFGTDFTPSRPEQIVEMGIIQVPEGRQIFPQMTVYDNLLIGGINKRAKSNRKEKLTEIFQLFPRLKERLSQLAGTMSGGEQQMLAIGRSLMGDPKLLILDEPSLGLAPIVVNEIFETLHFLNKDKGLSILLVEQNLHLSLKYADRGYVLERGEVVIEGTSQELSQNEQTRKAYLGL